MLLQDEYTIRQQATRFRLAIENTDFGNIRGLVHFPCGSCHHASAMLAMFFDESQLGTWLQVGGWSDARNCMHLWLEQAELVVDITANQFSDIDDEVIVSRDSAWHAQWRRDESKQQTYDPDWYADKFALVMVNLDQPRNDVAMKRRMLAKQKCEAASTILSILQNTGNSHWHQYKEDVFGTFRNSPVDEAGIPLVSGDQLRDRIRDELATNPDVYSRIEGELDEVASAWSEWQYALKHW